MHYTKACGSALLTTTSSCVEQNFCVDEVVVKTALPHALVQCCSSGAFTNRISSSAVFKTVLPHALVLCSGLCSVISSSVVFKTVLPHALVYYLETLLVSSKRTVCLY